MPKVEKVVTCSKCGLSYIGTDETDTEKDCPYQAIAGETTPWGVTLPKEHREERILPEVIQESDDIANGIYRLAEVAKTKGLRQYLNRPEIVSTLRGINKAITEIHDKIAKWIIADTDEGEEDFENNTN